MQQKQIKQTSIEWIIVLFPERKPLNLTDSTTLIPFSKTGTYMHDYYTEQKNLVFFL